MSSPNQFCAKCGSAIPAGSAFCPNCGSAVSAQPSGQPTSVPGPSYQYPRHRHEKQEKNEKNEKGRGGDISGAITGGLILIWLGVAFFLQENNYISSGNWWAYFLIGLGAIVILQGLLRYGMNRGSFIGSFIGGAVILVIGLAFVQGFSVNLWPLILVAIGAAILFSVAAGRQRRPAP